MYKNYTNKSIITRYFDLKYFQDYLKSLFHIYLVSHIKLSHEIGLSGIVGAHSLHHHMLWPPWGTPSTRAAPFQRTII